MTEPVKIAVIIPYFQRQPGILRRALTSVLLQQLPPNMHVDVIVVDDGSPLPAQSEVEGLSFAPPFTLTLIPQPNGGVGAARNTGLRATTAQTRYITFLDSDDSWHQGHLALGLTALEQGHDFYFCDNRRAGMHESSYASGEALIMPFARTANENGIAVLTRDELITLILKYLPCHISATMYRRSVAPDLFFNTKIRTAGEDMIYLMLVASACRSICFSTAVLVECGSGVNIFFGNMGWDSPGLIGTIIDKLRTHTTIQRTIALTPQSAAWNTAKIVSLRRHLAFHTLRRFRKSKGRWPAEVTAYARDTPGFWPWFTLAALQAVIGKPLGLYRPE